MSVSRRKEDRPSLKDNARQAKGDTGSPEVQVAILTEPDRQR